MDYILYNGVSYFCGWDILGQMQFTDEKKLAYRMKRPVAERTLEKLNTQHEGFFVTHM